MITKKQYDDAKKLIEEYEKQPKDDFVPGEFVQVRDKEYQEWQETVFVFNGLSDSGLYLCSPLGDYVDTTIFRYIRRPVDVPGIFTRWTGGECPVSNKDAEVIIQFRDGEVDSGTAGIYDWGHTDSPGDIIGYMIISEWMK